MSNKTKQIVYQTEEIIYPDDSLGVALGFTSDKFDGYLCLVGSAIYVSMIESITPGNGNLSKLFENILNKGYDIKVPTPLPKMKKILLKKSFVQTLEYNEILEEYFEVFLYKNKGSENV